MLEGGSWGWPAFGTPGRWQQRRLMFLPGLLLQCPLCPSTLAPLDPAWGKTPLPWAWVWWLQDGQAAQGCPDRCGLCCPVLADGAGTLPQPGCSQMCLAGGPGPGLGAPREWDLGMGPRRDWVGTSPCVLALHSWHGRSSEGAGPQGAVSGTGLDPAAHAVGGAMAAGKGLQRSAGATRA